MLITILLTTNTFTFKIYLRLIRLIRHAEFAMLFLKVHAIKKKHMFLFHYGKHKQIGGNRTQRTSTLPINVLNHGLITHFSINFTQRKNYYDFFSSGIVDAFLESVYEIYRLSKENKIQGYAEIINQQRGEIILEDKRVWLTNWFNSKYFNDFVRGEI